MNLRDISFMLLQLTDAQTKYIRALMLQPGTLFVDHGEDGEQFPGVHNRIAGIASAAGYQKEIVSWIRDRNQRPRFEIARYSQPTVLARAAP